MANNTPIEFAELPSEEEAEFAGTTSFSSAVVHATDWTTETIISQLRRGNISLNPRFQRRDAWKVQQKSRFIESLILGLPIPQIVLAEAKDRRGRFIVLDGKQRLLSLLQFWGNGEGINNGYALSGLEVRTQLSRKRLKDLESSPTLEDDYNALLNQPIRTVVIKNWPNVEFLHLVFLRLNTGSVKLSPQELRQALFPGDFTDWIDDQAVKSAGLRQLLHLSEPDYRMRDIEVLARFIAFRYSLSTYNGRMKAFLDKSYELFNGAWATKQSELDDACKEFEEACAALRVLFSDSVARKPGSIQFNRAIFDFLVFYAQVPRIRDQMLARADAVRAAYDGLFQEPLFVASVERDTAGISNTTVRFARWGETLGQVLGIPVPVPGIVEVAGEKRIAFAGF